MGAFSIREEFFSLALLAWTFGLRHAVDADHIAAIDNVTRKLVGMVKMPSLLNQPFTKK